MIETRQLCKTYRVPRKAPGLAGSVRALFHRETDDVAAVQGVDLRIEPGERVGFLGPNGAGKTTLLKMLSGLLVPTSGTCTVAGHTPHRRQAAFLEQITLVMGNKQQLLWDVPARETFELNRALFDLDRKAYDATVAELVELLDLGDLVDRPSRNLSLGERMKCELAAALLHRPKVLFLDEPTLGLDVRMQQGVREFVRGWNERHRATVLLTSHYMADIAALCPRVVVIDKGRVHFDGQLDALVQRYAPGREVVVRLLRPLTDDERAQAGPLVEERGRAHAVVPQSEVMGVVDRALRALPVADLVVEEPPLEDVIRRLFEDTRS